MAESINLSQLQNECRRLRKGQLGEKRNFQRRRTRLVALVGTAHDQLKEKLANMMDDTSDPEFKKSLELALYLMSTFREKWQVEEETLGNIVFPRKYNQRGDSDVWENILDDIDEQYDDMRRKNISYERAMLLEFLSLLDTLQRIQDTYGKCSMPEPTEKFLGQVISFFQSGLRRRNIQVLSIEIGSYPQPELTKILLREDEATSRDFIIHRIIEPGYTWHQKLLRKAAVTVISNHNGA